MAISHIVSAASGLGHQINTNVTITTNTQAGDIIVFAVTHKATSEPTISGTVITTGGVTLTKKVHQVFNTNCSATLYWGRATGDHLNQTIIADNTTDSVAGGCSVYRDCVASGDPIYGLVTEINASGDVSSAGVTTPTNGCMINVSILVADNPTVGAVTSTNPASYTQRYQRANSGGTDTNATHVDALRTTAGSTGTINWTFNVAAPAVSFAYALLPSGYSGGGGTPAQTGQMFQMFV